MLERVLGSLGGKFGGKFGGRLGALFGGAAAVKPVVRRRGGKGVAAAQQRASEYDAGVLWSALLLLTLGLIMV